MTRIMDGFINNIERLKLYIFIIHTVAFGQIHTGCQQKLEKIIYCSAKKFSFQKPLPTTYRVSQ